VGLYFIWEEGRIEGWSNEGDENGRKPKGVKEGTVDTPLSLDPLLGAVRGGEVQDEG
jgi:hypothetical protein